MKKLLLSFLLLAACVCGFSQNFGNEWINYSQQYFEIKTRWQGVYKLDYSTLQNSGVPISTINPKNFQIFSKEQEIPIKVVGENDNSFDPGDYIEFYLDRNFIFKDSSLFRNSGKYANENYSLFNDTIISYLTWNNSLNNKRIVQDLDSNFNNYIPSTNFRYESYYSSKFYYNQGTKDAGGGSSSLFSDGEGWGDVPLNAFSVTFPSSVKHEVKLTTNNPYFGIDASPAIISGIVSGASDSDPGLADHHLQFQYFFGGYQTLLDTVYSGYDVLRLSYGVPANTISSSGTYVTFRYVPDLTINSDFQSGIKWQVNYPHTLNLENKSEINIIVPYNNIESKTRYQFSNFNGINPRAIVFSENNVELKVINNEVLVPNNAISGEEQSVFYFDDSEVNLITNLKPVNNTSYFNDLLGTNLDSAYIIITNSKLINAAQEYSNYRMSLLGGGHNVLIADVNELYNQFGGGIQKHSISIVNFLKAYTHYNSKPSYLFLIGKGVRDATLTNNGTDHGSRKSSISYAMNLVPSMGYPPSDNLFSADLSGATSHPEIATGRLAANDSTEVILYLNKIIEFEANHTDLNYNKQNKDWMKQVLHFSGGANTTEQNAFKGYLANYESIIEDTCYGGNVTTFSKTSSQPIDPAEYQEIQDKLESGVSLITFFGHASPTGFDQNIEDPINWNNQGKYPLLIGNSCYTGGVHEPNTNSTSEEFVLVEDRGVIGFLASVNLGLSNYLSVYSGELYKQISYKSYGETIGNQIINTIKTLENSGLNFVEYQNVYHQMTLHGDPAIRLNPHPKPEYDIELSDVYFEPSLIDLSVDSITVNCVVTNLGKAIGDSLKMEFQRVFPGASNDTIYQIDVPGVYYKDTISIKMPLNPNVSIGLNTFNINIDIPSLIDETAFEISNNQISKNLLINLDGISPIYPYDFAIIPNDSVVLKASTIDPLASFKTYLFEIDTIDFDGMASNFKMYQKVQSIGGVVEAYPNNWISYQTGDTVNFNVTDSTVCFWRVSIDSSANFWKEHSFQVINSKRGWGQAHFHQFKNNEFNSLIYDKPNRRFDFENKYRLIECNVVGNASNSGAYSNTLWSLDGNVDDGEYNLCGTYPSIHVAIVDPFELKALETNYNGLNPNNDFGNIMGCRNREEGYFIFRPNSASSMASLDSLISHKIPDGYYCLIYTTKYAKYDDWDNNYPQMYQVMQNFGATQIDTSSANVPFILFKQIGDQSTFKEVYGATISSTINLQDTVFASNYIGNTYSEIAGPAYGWETLYWSQQPEELSGNDSTRIKLFGITQAGLRAELVDTIFTTNDSLVNLSNYINATNYPFAQLQMYTQDSSTFTPAQLKRWQLIYSPVPELAINPKKGYYNTGFDTLMEGNSFDFAVAIENVSDFDMDSLLVKYDILDQNNVLNQIPYNRQKPMPAGEVLLDTINISTNGLNGLNSINLEVNPYVSTGFQDQFEQYYFNNLLSYSFNVSPDNTNPILDVTFDGIHILDGDLVSGKPNIVMSLDDENEYLIFDSESDTANFQVWLTDPQGSLNRVYFQNGIGEQILVFNPATGSDNKCSIEYNPTLIQDGVYKMLVQATDKSGNLSGDYGYEVSFEVVNHSTITEILNYPNPFSTKTRFVFTLTGNELPTEFKIQIMTITGKVVKEITLDELGSINIGRNITDYYWDGRDQFGDQLANGVYLYTVTAKINGEDIELHSTRASVGFKKGFGKMYLMR